MFYLAKPRFCYPILLDFDFICEKPRLTHWENSLIHTSHINKTNNTFLCRLWGFILDAFELDGGLKTESLWKVCFLGFIGSGTTQKFVFPRKNQDFQSGTYKTLVLVYKLLFSEKRDSRNTFGLECGLHSQSHWEVGFVCCFGSDTVKKLVSPNKINIQVCTSVLPGKSNVLLP